MGGDRSSPDGPKGHSCTGRTVSPARRIPSASTGRIRREAGAIGVPAQPKPTPRHISCNRVRRLPPARQTLGRYRIVRYTETGGIVSEDETAHAPPADVD